jgi:hypothetical protein
MSSTATVIRRLVEKPREIVEGGTEQVQAWIERFERVDLDAPTDTKRPF